MLCKARWPLLRQVNPIGENEAPGTAVVSVVVPGSAHAIWVALTDRTAVSQWFGDLSGSLWPGAAVRLDFGDGDFFDISDIRFDLPYRLNYTWRFLGTSPCNEISWSIDPLLDNCRVTVADAERGRSADGVREMIEGWTDFMCRLQAYCATGHNSRYTWRREFSGSVELPMQPTAAFKKLMSEDVQALWMPWSGAAVASGASITVADRERPGQLLVTAVEASGPQALRFSLGSADWHAATHCHLKIQPWECGALLVILHDGWETIDTNATVQGVQRTRFGKLWTRALERAREVAQG